MAHNKEVRVCKNCIYHEDNAPDDDCIEQFKRQYDTPPYDCICLRVVKRYQKEYTKTHLVSGESLPYYKIVGRSLHSTACCKNQRSSDVCSGNSFWHNFIDLFTFIRKFTKHCPCGKKGKYFKANE